MFPPRVLTAVTSDWGVAQYNIDISEQSTASIFRVEQNALEANDGRAVLQSIISWLLMTGYLVQSQDCKRGICGGVSSVNDYYT